jgi:predicted ATPase
VLYDPEPPKLIGIEEPENQLHPRLLPELAGECRTASANSQLMVTTHSPFLINSLRPKEVWVIYRDAQGYTQAKRTADMRGIKEFIDNGATLGDLWMEDFFDVGNPLINDGASTKHIKK